jgi:hypothetical protein
MIAVQERPNLPVTLYKNTHLQILIYKKTQTEMHFLNHEMQNPNTPRKGRWLDKAIFSWSHNHEVSATPSGNA